MIETLECNARMVSHPRLSWFMRLAAALCLSFFSLPALSAQQPEEKTAAASGSSTPAVDGARQLAEARQKLKKLSGTEYDLDGIHINASTREVRFPAQVCLKKAPIEYMLTTDTGKTHETVLTTVIQPTAIQVALLLASYEAATEGLLKDVPEDERPKVWKEEPPKTPGGNRVKIDIEWKAGDQVKKAPLKLMVQNVDTRKPPPDLDTWVFNGSYIDERGFIAQHEGSIIAVWLDRGAIINSAAKGNWRDDLWISLPDNIPDEATPVTVIITPAQP
ncbi:MAG: hypothetical protein CJBNEKGG_03237 [Prosthecobacter sp.]|nr:hypothetical protein [Prosthecobacter sp.]